MAEEAEEAIPATRQAWSLDETAEILGISRELLNDLIRTGKLQSTKAGRRRIIGQWSIDEFLGKPVAA